MKSKRPPSIIDYLLVVFKRRYIIIKLFAAFTLATAIISLVVPSQYTATTTILPPSAQQEGLFGLMGASFAASLGDITGLSGMLPGMTSTSDLFASILGSGTIGGRVIKTHDLSEVFKTKTMNDTYEMLNDITTIRVSPEGIISVSVTWYDKNLAADIANSYADELNKFNTETAMTLGQRYRIFIEQRVKETADSLAKAEEALKHFQEKHHTIALDIEIETAIGTIAELKKQIILLEVKKGALSSTSYMNNPELNDINRELRELKKQLSQIEFGDTTINESMFGAGFAVPFSNLPDVSLEYARLYREVQVQQAVYEVLVQQYEQAKIMELKDTPSIQVLDRASPPEKRSAPKRSRMIVLAGLFSLMLGIAVVFVLEWYETLRTRPSEYTIVMNIKTKLKDDFASLKSMLHAILKPITTHK
jgi:tyrosine-protein kinase Etk/Wzc